MHAVNLSELSVVRSVDVLGRRVSLDFSPMNPRNLLGALAGFSAWAGVLACSSATHSDDSCANLLSCCEQLSPADQQACAQLASAGSDTLCAAELTTYQASGCGVSGTLPEAGTKTDSGLGSGSGTGACAALSACCAATALPSADVAAYHTYLTTDDNTLCASALTTFSAAGYCGSASSDAGHSGDSGAVTRLDAGSGTGGGPAILSLSANPTTVSPTSSAIISAVVSDSAGVETLAGGTLIDEATGHRIRKLRDAGWSRHVPVHRDVGRAERGDAGYHDRRGYRCAERTRQVLR